MKTIPDVSSSLAAALAALALGGCAASQGGPSAAGSEPPSGPFYGIDTATGGTSAGNATRHSGEEAKCAMEKDMQDMSPEERRRHMETMRQHCK
ncbi:hypothetical protein [Massilia sp.]|uniref:hypothetical protein n=1 Tax=Massilia sp. TaxID=1882437 RepID=UPI00391A804E